MKRTPEYFMQEALKQAAYAYDNKEIPVGAVIVCNNKIIAKGYNQVELLKDVTAHAEMIAITSAANFLQTKYLNNCELYVTLEPCTMCIGALEHSHINKVYFGAPDNNKSSVIKPSFKMEGGILSEVCSELLNNFFIELRNLN